MARKIAVTAICALAMLLFVLLAYRAGQESAPPLRDIMAVSSSPGCAPEHHGPCEVYLQEYDSRGYLIVSATYDPEEPISRLFE